MTSRPIRVAIAIFLITFLSACQMTVQVTTHVNGNGSGTLAMHMNIDKELRVTLEGSNSGAGISSIEALYARLRDQGWTVTRTEPSGALDLLATRAFADQKGFDSVVNELSNGGASPLRALGYSLGYRTHSSFLKTKTEFTGRVDTSALLDLVEATITKGNKQAAQAILNGAGDNFRFEVRAILPGAVGISSGDGTVTDGVAIWRPSLGSRVDLAASSSAIKTGTLLALGIPVLLLLAGLGWFLIGRRQKTLIAEAPTPADRRRERISVPKPAAEQLLAILPEPEPTALDAAPVIDLTEVEQAQKVEPTA